jgi:EmrB/QacA subfamily drug resistance transporter
MVTSRRTGTDASSADGGDKVTGRWWTLTAVSLATLLLFAYVMMAPFALGAIQRDLHASFGELQWVVDAYSLTLAALLLPAGSLADRLGRRRIFLAGLAVFTIAAIGCAVAPSAPALDLLSGLQGIGAAGMLATSLALLAGAFPGKARATAMGVWGAALAGGLVVGPVAAAALVGAINWRAVYVLLAVLGLVTIVLTFMKVTKSATTPGRIDYLGAIFLGACLLCLVVALVQGNTWGFASAPVLGLLGGAIVALVVFVLVERRVTDPMLDLSLFRVPSFTGAAAAAMAAAAANFGLTFYIVIYLLDEQQRSPLAAAARFLPITGASLLVSPFAGRLIGRLPARILLAVPLAVIAGGDLLLHGISAGTGYTSLLAGFILVGLGAGAINPPLGATAVGVVPTEHAGMASGVNNTFRQMGTALGIAGFGAVFVHEVAGHLGGVVPSGSPVVGLIASGKIADAAAAAPHAAAHVITQRAPAAFFSGLNATLIWIAAVAVAGAVLAALLVRARDFAASRSAAQPEAGEHAPAAAAQDGNAPSQDGHGPSQDGGTRPVAAAAGSGETGSRRRGAS